MTEPTRLYRSRTDRMRGGVAGGLGRYLGVDPVIIRLAIVALVFAGIGVVAYIVAWVIVPEEPPGTEPVREEADSTIVRTSGSQGARIIFGTILVAVGFMLLLDWLIPSIDRFFWPIALIGLGIALFTFGARR